MSPTPARGAGHGGPRRGYSWAPFKPGNPGRMVHGARSRRMVLERVEVLRAELVERSPGWLDHVDAAAVEAWLYSEAQLGMLRDYLSANGLLDDEGKPSGAARLWLSVERRAASARAALGFTPTSRAELGRDTALARHLAADGLAAVADAGAATVDSPRAALPAPEPPESRPEYQTPETP